MSIFVFHFLNWKNKKENLTQILIFQLMTLTYTHLSCFLNYIWQRCRCIYLYIYFFHIQIFFLVNFHYVTNVFYLKITESSYSALISRANVVLESLKTRIGRSSLSAGRVYFTPEKPAHIHIYVYIHRLYLSSDLQCNSWKLIKWNKRNDGNMVLYEKN